MKRPARLSTFFTIPAQIKESKVPDNDNQSTRRRVQRGEASSEVTPSAYVGGNERLFPQVLHLHVPQGSTVADVTFGRGVFWKNVDRTKYVVKASDLCLDADIAGVFPDLDIETGVDFGNLPYASASIDAIVLDPPYMEGFYRDNASARAGQGTHSSFQRAYSSGKETQLQSSGTSGRLAWQDRVVDSYLRGAAEAHRVLKTEGVLIVKCQDAVSANLQRLAHIEIITALEHMGFYCKDIFVLVRPAKASVSRVITQVHARKNHSYFLVFVKTKNRAPVCSCRKCRFDSETP